MSADYPPASTVAIPFSSVHAAMGVVGSLSARTRHLDESPEVTVESRHRNIVTFTGAPEALAEYVNRLNERGLLSPFVYNLALSNIPTELEASTR